MTDLPEQRFQRFDVRYLPKQHAGVYRWWCLSGGAERKVWVEHAGLASGLGGVRTCANIAFRAFLHFVFRSVTMAKMVVVGAG